jgi:hypothetical protein
MCGRPRLINRRSAHDSGAAIGTVAFCNGSEPHEGACRCFRVACHSGRKRDEGRYRCTVPAVVPRPSSNFCIGRSGVLH